MPHHPWAAPHKQDGEDEDDVDEDEDDQKNQKPEKRKCWKTFISHPSLSATVPSCPQPGGFKYPIPIISCKIGDVTKFL